MDVAPALLRAEGETVAGLAGEVQMAKPKIVFAKSVMIGLVRLGSHLFEGGLVIRKRSVIALPPHFLKTGLPDRQYKFFISVRTNSRPNFQGCV